MIGWHKADIFHVPIFNLVCPGRNALRHHRLMLFAIECDDQCRRTQITLLDLARKAYIVAKLDAGALQTGQSVRGDRATMSSGKLIGGTKRLCLPADTQRVILTF